MKGSAFDNLKRHIEKMHPEVIPDEPSIKQEVTKKQAKYNGAASMSIVKFMKPSLKQHKVEITRRLYIWMECLCLMYVIASTAARLSIDKKRPFWGFS